MEHLHINLHLLLLAILCLFHLKNLVEINLLEAKDIVLDYKADVDKVDFVKVEAYKEKF